jgi:glycosyltransferase involved in cell wall biosynthesis
MGGYAIVSASRVAGMPLSEAASELFRPAMGSIALVVTVVIFDHLLEPAARSPWPGLPLLMLELACGVAAYGAIYRVSALVWRKQRHIGIHTADQPLKVIQGRQPTFSVVMPAFNSEGTIGTAIRSVQRQTRSDFEVLVVDDGSTDRTAAVVEAEQARDSRVRLFRSSHFGPSHARNLALAEARGAYISLLDSDDVYLPSYLEAMHATLTANARAAIAMTDAWLFEDVFGRLKRRTALSTSPTLPSDPGKLFDLLLEDNHVFGLVMMRQSLVENLGGFEERRHVAEDYEYWLRAVSIGATIARAPGIHAVYRLSPASTSADRRKRLEDRAFVYQIVETEYAHLDVEVRERARRRRRQAERELACLTRLSPESAVFRLRYWARCRAGVLRRRVMPRRVWMEMPPDVAGALGTDRS